MLQSKTILLLGSGELGKELTISLKRLGQRVIAVDRYPQAPAHQVADAFEVIDMLNGDELERLVKKHHPDVIVPEIEAIRTEKLKDFEAQGLQVVPTAEAAHLTMNRDAIREVAAKELKLKTARYLYADSLAQLQTAAQSIGFPCVVKPVMSSSGKGQSVVRSKDQLESAWRYALEGKRGDQTKIIVEEFIDFHLEITLLTIRQKQGKTLFLPPIGHVQIAGDYRESWMPAKISASQLLAAQRMAKKITDRLGGAGLFGVEFFVTSKGVYFSELSPRPHDTGMVTLISQDLSEFDLHARAILGLPIPEILSFGPAASAVVLADAALTKVNGYEGVEKALRHKNVEVRIFGKPVAHKNRRMAVVLARARTTKLARQLATKAARGIYVV